MVVLTEISDQSSSSSSIYQYDVFLSFRGTDTRYNFTDHLLKALREATIDMFFDDSEIQIGEFLKPELENAIKLSRASIIVLSKDYASSTWCLDELALIMEQRRTSEHIFSPIFYHVKPSDVRKQRNSFGDAIVEHKQRLKTLTNEEKRSQLAKKIEKWEKALTEVADMKGVEANGRETIMIEGIVKEISSRLDIHKRSEIPKLIGMDYSVRIITSFLKDGSQKNPEFLTIWEMAGIGKTYLANYVFQLHYLEDIERKCEAPNGLLDLQKQLLKDIRARNWMDVNNLDVATFKIEKSLFRNRTLLVLDGVNKIEQLNLLIGTKGLHPGSKIIITSKNGSLTEKCRLFDSKVPPKHMKHMLQGLNDEESLQLLSWHAFGRNIPNEGDKKESMKVIRYCKGHPLALKVLGSSLRSEDATWEDILESLGKEINQDIKMVLKVSFDALPSEKDKELFKYIACLFVGEDRKFTEDTLKACGICKSSGIKILINRCLLTVESSNKLMMHQLLQDMGRDIVRQESPMKPWKRSILWHHEECLDVLQNRQVINWFLGMRSLFYKTKGDFETLALSEMRNLRLLQLNYVQLSGSYKNFPQCLRLLCMHGFPLSYIPTDIQMENMVALDMSNSKTSTTLEEAQVGASCQKLEVLDLTECNKLKELPRSISKLKNLKSLLINGCSNLGEFPCEIKDMRSLEVLQANSINIESNASSSAIVEALPRSLKTVLISLPSSLVTLSLKNNKLSNEFFPKDFSSLSMLKKLDLDGNPIDSLPDCVRSLIRLDYLNLNDCRRLKTVLSAPNTLKRLSTYDCFSLEQITFHPEKSAPLEIDYYDSNSLTEIQDKFKLQVLAEINEEVLHSLRWIDIEYLNDYKVAMADCDGCYHCTGKMLPAQLKLIWIFRILSQSEQAPVKKSI
ncbi:hypothetical protein R6Q57_007642 [Mikania cordata]